MSILLESVKALLIRDLNKLRTEIDSYPDSESIWALSGDIKNTAGNLCLHLCGNLQHYIGKHLGNSSYIRNRDAEFLSKNLSKEVLIKEINTTLQVVENTLNQLNPVILDQSYPEDVFSKPMTTGYFLIHLAGHLNYHLGQINYHRRLLHR